MKKGKEKEIRILEFFCIITAVIASVLSIMFLFDYWQIDWFLNVIMGLSVLLHLALVFLMILGKKKARAIASGMVALFYAGALLYFNLF